MSDKEIEDAKQLREEFLKDAHKIVARIKGAYTERSGDAMLTNQEETVMKQIWPTLEKIILSAEDTHKLEVKNASQVLTLVSQGKLTVQEGKEFMVLLKMQAEIQAIETGGQLPEGHATPGITVVLQGQDMQPTAPKPPINEEGDKT